MALVPFQTFDDFVAEGGDDTASTRVYVNRPRTPGSQGVAGPAGVGGIIGSKNVLAFGAVGDGISDDTAAFTLAQTAAILTGNNVLYVPPGNYKLINFEMHPGIRLTGAGPLASTLCAGRNDSSIVTYTAEAIVNGILVDNVGFNRGTYTGVTALNVDGNDNAKRVSMVWLENIYLYATTGVKLRFCANVWMTKLFANACTTGFWLDSVADAHLMACQAQNGSSYGFLIEGTTGAFDEGIKLTSCSTNGQVYGISILGQDWGQMANCSFSTCSGGVITLSNCNNWRITTTDVAAANDVAAGISMDADCHNIQISDCFVALNSFGIVLAGSKHSVKGCNFEGNENSDIYLTATRCIVSDNGCNSVEPFSITEYGAADYNNIHDNICRGAVTIVGSNTQDHDNLIAA